VINLTQSACELVSESTGWQKPSLRPYAESTTGAEFLESQSTHVTFKDSVVYNATLLLLYCIGPGPKWQPGVRRLWLLFLR
jgi:hypothetical protein